MEWIKIIHAERVDQLKIYLTFNDGINGVFDFEPIAEGGILKKLQDPVFFKEFDVVRNGRALEWPDGIDFCADALHMSIMENKYSNQNLFLSATNK